MQKSDDNPESPAAVAATPAIRFDSDLTPVDAVLSAVLSSDSRQSGFNFAPESVCLSLVYRNEIVGGLSGRTNWGWLYIEKLAVRQDLRGQGFGVLLVMEAEKIARARNCIGAWVDTYSFQSPRFYQKLGYEEFGRLPHYPREELRIFFRKVF